MSPGRLRGDLPIARILVIRTDRLGETVLNLPLLAALKQAFPEASVTWLVNPELVDLLRHAPGVDRVLGYEADGSSIWQRVGWLARRFRAEQFDLALISNPKKEFHVATWVAGIPLRVGYDRKWGRLLTHRIPNRKAVSERHEIEYNLDLLNALGLIVRSTPALQLPVAVAEDRAIAHLLDSWQVGPMTRLIGIHPWTSNPRKQWPVARFHTLLQRLSGRSDSRLVVIGGREEAPRVSELLRGDLAQVLDVVGQLSLPQVAALLRRMCVFVSNDSGPVHLAAAVGTPTVVVFGTTDPAASPVRWGPWGAGHTVIWKPAMEAITVEEVLQAVQRHLPADMPCAQ